MAARPTMLAGGCLHLRRIPMAPPPPYGPSGAATFAPPSQTHENAGRSGPRPSVMWSSAACRRVAYHGRKGAFAQLACTAALKHAEAMGFETLEQTFDAVRKGDADAAVVPCENLIAGRVADIHLLLPDCSLSIVGEHFHRIELSLAALPGATLSDIKRVHSHPMALRQATRLIAHMKLTPVQQPNTAIAADHVLKTQNPADAVIASRDAAMRRGLVTLRNNVEDQGGNMTRFYILAATAARPRRDTAMMTTVLFDVPDKPAALFTALQGFAQNGVNITRLESYVVERRFVSTRFLCEFEGHDRLAPVQKALAHLDHHARRLRVLGVYPISQTSPRQAPTSLAS